jgi:hypothetical protein
MNPSPRKSRQSIASSSQKPGLRLTSALLHGPAGCILSRSRTLSRLHSPVPRDGRDYPPILLRRDCGVPATTDLRHRHISLVPALQFGSEYGSAVGSVRLYNKMAFTATFELLRDRDDEAP